VSGLRVYSMFSECSARLCAACVQVEGSICPHLKATRRKGYRWFTCSTCSFLKKMVFWLFF